MALNIFFGRGNRFLFAALLFAILSTALTSAAKAAPVSIVDDAGETVTLPAPARRVIPLYAGLSEILKAMGQEDRVVGKTAADSSLSENLPVVGTHMRPNAEVITALGPDLTIILEGREEAALAAQQLRRLGLVVARFRIASLEDMFACARKLGVLTGEEGAAERFIAEQEKRLSAVAQAVSRLPRKPSVFFEVRYPNLLGAGGGNLVSDIIRRAGGRNCLESYPEKMVRLGEETLVLLNPDIYILQVGPMNKNPLPPEKRAIFSSLSAVRTGNTLVVDEENFSRPGPRSVTAVETLFSTIEAWAREARAQ